MSTEPTANSLKPEDPVLLDKLYRLFRDYFRRAEKKRRWSVDFDIPWNQTNASLNPAIADVVETFCCVELYLPDYLSKLIHQVRASRGRAWFLANWGYEESKHSMALADWLLKSGQRSDEQMADIEARVFQQEWDLPHDSALGMVCYTMMQELATWVNYRNLRQVVKDSGGDPALEHLLDLVSIDERAHFDFFTRIVRLYLDHDREATIEQLRRVSNSFKMPALQLLFDSSRRVAQVNELHIFDDEMFFQKVFEPSLTGLGLVKNDLKPKRSKPAKIIVGD